MLINIVLYIFTSKSCVKSTSKYKLTKFTFFVVQKFFRYNCIHSCVISKEKNWYLFNCSARLFIYLTSIHWRTVFDEVEHNLSSVVRILEF